MYQRAGINKGKHLSFSFLLWMPFLRLGTSRLHFNSNNLNTFLILFKKTFLHVKMAIALKLLWHFILKLGKRNAVIKKVVLPISLIYNLTFKFLHERSEIVIIQSFYLYISKNRLYIILLSEAHDWWLSCT